MADVHGQGIGRARNCTASVLQLKQLVETHAGVANELRDAVALYQVRVPARGTRRVRLVRGEGRGVST
jgi:hypothetical protein